VHCQMPVHHRLLAHPGALACEEREVLALADAVLADVDDRAQVPIVARRAVRKHRIAAPAAGIAHVVGARVAVAAVPPRPRLARRARPAALEPVAVIAAGAHLRRARLTASRLAGSVRRAEVATRGVVREEAIGGARRATSRAGFRDVARARHGPADGPGGT